MKTISLAFAALALLITPACAQYRTFPTPYDMRPGMPVEPPPPRPPLRDYLPPAPPPYTQPPAFPPFGGRQYIPNPNPPPFGPW